MNPGSETSTYECNPCAHILKDNAQPGNIDIAKIDKSLTVTLVGRMTNVVKTTFHWIGVCVCNLSTLCISLNWAIPCKRSEKKGQRQKVDFFYETWKIIRQIDDFCRFLNNFGNFWVILAKNKKYPKMTVLEKWKLKNKNKIVKIEQLFWKIHISFL